MHLKFNKSIEKMSDSFNKLEKLSRFIIVYGSKIAFYILLLSSIVFVINTNSKFPNDMLDVNSIALIKASYYLLAVSIMGGFIVDYFIKSIKE